MRPITTPMKRINRAELAIGRELYPDRGEWRPTTRADCLDGGLNAARPCPFVSCRYHLYLDVTSCGSIKIYQPQIAIEDMVESCALDLADRGAWTLEALGELHGVHRERIRQIQDGALEALQGAAESLRDLLRPDYSPHYPGLRSATAEYVEDAPGEAEEHTPIIDRSADTDLLRCVWESSSPVTGARMEAYLLAHPWRPLSDAAAACGITTSAGRVAFLRTQKYAHHGVRYAVVSQSGRMKAVDYVVASGGITPRRLSRELCLWGRPWGIVRRHLDAVCLDRESGLYVDPRRLGC